jgi:hypothetical protein
MSNWRTIYFYSTIQLILECYWLDGEIKGPKYENRSAFQKLSVKVMMSFFVFRLISIGFDSVNILYTAVILGSAGSKKK